MFTMVSNVCSCSAVAGHLSSQSILCRLSRRHTSADVPVDVYPAWSYTLGNTYIVCLTAGDSLPLLQTPSAHLPTHPLTLERDMRTADQTAHRMQRFPATSFFPHHHITPRTRHNCRLPRQRIDTLCGSETKPHEKVVLNKQRCPWTSVANIPNLRRRKKKKNNLPTGRFRIFSPLATTHPPVKTFQITKSTI